LATVARRAVRKHGVKLIVVDYLQIMEHKSEGKGDAYYIRVGNTSRKLKQLAKQLGVALIALAQINRDSDNSERPTMSHIRDSGNIEQDADIVILIHPETIPSGIAPGPVQKVELIIDKQRAGPKAIVNLNYRRANVRFEQPR
jgi:replicative DNA helicase